MMDLVRKIIPDHMEIRDLSTKPLTAVGDNYGSLMTAVTVTIADKSTGKEEVLELVAKNLPKDPWLLSLFQVDKTFVKEAGIYTVVVPLLKQFQEDKAIPENLRLNTFISCLGARSRRDPHSERIDKDAVLILENLKYQDFCLGERSIGFSFKDSEYILREMARLHALFIAFREQRPQVFISKVLPYLNKLNMLQGHNKEQSPKDQEALVQYLTSNPQVKVSAERLNRHIEMCKQRLSDVDWIADSPFNTLGHTDLWVNNMMIKYDEKQEPIGVKFFDFQFIKYDTVVEDVLFFLFTSVRNELLTDNFDHFVDLYYNSLENYLKLHGCEIEGITKECFLEEIEKYAKYELFHILFMTRVFFFNKKRLQEVLESGKEMNYDELLGPDYYERITLVVVEFEKRGWIIN